MSHYLSLYMYWHTLVPEVFLDFSPRERAAKLRARVAKRLSHAGKDQGGIGKGKLTDNLHQTAHIKRESSG